MKPLIPRDFNLYWVKNTSLKYKITDENIFVYDFYWRLYRNLNIRNLDDFNFHLKGNASYTSIKNIIDAQSKVSANLLQNGFLSKGYMVFNYLKNNQHQT